MIFTLKLWVQNRSKTLFFFISGSNPNTVGGGITFQNDSMIQVALSLLATALETGAEHLDKYESLLDLVKDDLTRNLVLLLSKSFDKGDSD